VVKKRGKPCPQELGRVWISGKMGMEVWNQATLKENDLGTWPGESKDNTLTQYTLILPKMGEETKFLPSQIHKGERETNSEKVGKCEDGARRAKNSRKKERGDGFA